jgi:hypothetical protein
LEWLRAVAGACFVSAFLLASPLCLELGLGPRPRDAGQDLRGKDAGLRRNLYTLVVRTALINEACLLQGLDVKTGAREANPQRTQDAS